MPGCPISFVPAAFFTVQYWAAPHHPTCLNDMLASGHSISIKKIRKINSGEISLQKKETKAGAKLPPTIYITILNNFNAQSLDHPSLDSTLILSDIVGESWKFCKQLG